MYMPATIIQTEMFKSRVIYLIPHTIEKPLSYMLCYQVWPYVLLYSLFITLNQLPSLPAPDREGCQDFPSLIITIHGNPTEKVHMDDEELCLKNPRATNLVTVDYKF